MKDEGLGPHIFIVYPLSLITLLILVAEEQN
jgi:hypothetical protein